MNSSHCSSKEANLPFKKIPFLKHDFQNFIPSSNEEVEEKNKEEFTGASFGTH